MQRDQVLKLSVDFLRASDALYSSLNLQQWSKALHTVRKKCAPSVMSPVAPDHRRQVQLEMYWEQKKASEMESPEVMEVRRFWGTENGNEGDSRRKLRNKKDWEHPH